MNKLIKSESRKKSTIERQKHNRLLMQWSFRIGFDITDTNYLGHQASTRLQKFKNYLKDTYLIINIDKIYEKFKFRSLQKRIKSCPEFIEKVKNEELPLLSLISKLKIK